jgi:hypothetical protein
MNGGQRLCSDRGEKGGARQVLVGTVIRGHTCQGAECPYKFDELNQNSATCVHGVGWSFCRSPDRGSGPDEHGTHFKF